MFKPRVPLLIAFAAVGACAHQPIPEPIASPAPRAAAQPERTADSWIDHYVAEKERERLQLRAAGLGSDWDFIRERVVQHLPSQSYPAQSEAAQALLREAHVQSTTSFLVRIGYRAHHLAHPSQARTVVRAGNISSWDDADALVLVSPTVFVAELVRIDRKPDNSAELVYRVREPIKSAPAKGAEFRYPLNGPFPTVVAKPGDPPPPPPLPNPAAWGLSSRRAVLFFRSAPDGMGNFFGPMPIDGDKVLPGYHSTTTETTLASIRAAARAQICSPGFVPVASGGGHSLPCQPVSPPQPAAPKPLSWEEHRKRYPDTFIATVDQQHAADARQLGDLGLGPDLAAIRGVVDRFLPPRKYPLYATGATPEIMRRQEVEKVALYLTQVGYRRAHVVRDEQAKRLVRAGASVFGGPEEETAMAMVAPTVLVADLLRFDQPGDGSATLVYTVVEPLKNGLPEGAEIRFTLRGPASPGSPPPPPQPGESELTRPGRVVLFLSQPRAALYARGSVAGNSFARLTTPMNLDKEGRVTPGYHSAAPDTTLTALRAAIRKQLCSKGYVPVGPAMGPSLAC